MPPSCAECEIMSILVNILGGSPLSESHANDRLPARDEDDVSDAFGKLQNEDFIKNGANGGILLKPDDFNEWSRQLYNCRGWNPRSLRERMSHHWESKFFGL